jgi:hypothetical protein
MRITRTVMTRRGSECGQTKFHIFNFSIYSTGSSSLTEEKRMSCGRCGPKTKVKAMPTKKKATKKKKK